MPPLDFDPNVAIVPKLKFIPTQGLYFDRGYDQNIPGVNSGGCAGSFVYTGDKFALMPAAYRNALITLNMNLALIRRLVAGHSLPIAKSTIPSEYDKPTVHTDPAVIDFFVPQNIDYVANAILSNELDDFADLVLPEIIANITPSEYMIADRSAVLITVTEYCGVRQGGSPYMVSANITQNITSVNINSPANINCGSAHNIYNSGTTLTFAKPKPKYVTVSCEWQAQLPNPFDCKLSALLLAVLCNSPAAIHLIDEKINDITWCGFSFFEILWLIHSDYIEHTFKLTPEKMTAAYQALLNNSDLTPLVRSYAFDKDFILNRGNVAKPKAGANQSLQLQLV
jgi:hypothetical protein